MNYFVQTAQLHYEVASQETARTLASPTSTGLDRQSAIEGKLLSAGGNLAATRMDVTTARLNANLNAFNMYIGAMAGMATSIIAYSEAIGSTSRSQMEAYHALARHPLSFQGHYHLRPFYNEGRGVTIIDLATGKRCDLVFSPGFTYSKASGSVMKYARPLELPTFAVDPSGKWLLTVDIGLNPANYQEYSNINFITMPRSSVLAYELSTLPFKESFP